MIDMTQRWVKKRITGFCEEENLANRTEKFLDMIQQNFSEKTEMRN